eukprot:8008380-Prorocentrum_lima.AAC.1
MHEYSTAASYKYDGNTYNHDSYQSLIATHNDKEEHGSSTSGSKKTGKYSGSIFPSTEEN